MNYNNLSQPYFETYESKEKLPVRKNKPFIYKHHPKNYSLHYFEIEIEEEVKKGKTELVKKQIPMMLPELTPQKQNAGVNGMDSIGRGRVDMSLFITKEQNKGWSFLNPNTHDYLRIYPCLNGKFYTTKWNTLENLGGLLVENFNHEEFANWRRQLVLDGHIKPVHPHIVKLRIIELKRLAEKKYNSQHIPQIAEQLNNLQKMIGDLESIQSKLQKNPLDAYKLQK